MSTYYKQLREDIPNIAEQVTVDLLSLIQAGKLQIGSTNKVELINSWKEAIKTSIENHIRIETGEYI